MRRYSFNRLMTAAVITSVTLMTAACNKTSAPVDTLLVGTESTADTSAEASLEAEVSSEVETTKTAVTESRTASGTDGDTKAAKDKNTKDGSAGTSGNDVSGSTEPSGESASPAETTVGVPETTVAAKASEAATTKEPVTETTTSKVTESTTAATQAPAEKATEKQTEKPTEAPTQKPTENTTTPTEKATQAHTHSYAATVTKQPTCTAVGTRTYKCSCGDSYTEAIPATGHSYGTYTYNNDATELADGTETAACTICGAKDTRTAAGTKIAHVHNYTAAVTKAATCAEEGVKTYTCSCGSSYTEAVPVIAHSFGDYIYNDDATTEKDGTKTATCSICGVTDTVTAEGTKKSLPSWYDEHPGIPLNVATGNQIEGTLEAYFDPGQFNWDSYADGCWDFDYNATMEFVGIYAEGHIYHGYLYK